MGRILPILALIIAVGVSVVAVIELDSRSDDDDVALPTVLPSPGLGAPTDGPTEAPEPTRGAAQATDEPTRAPTPSETSDPEETVAPEPRATAEPPRTPTPEPAVTVGPVDTSRGRTPTTGGDSAPAGVVITAVALGLRGLLARRRRSY